MLTTVSTGRRLQIMKYGLTFVFGWMCAFSIGTMKSVTLDHADAAVITIRGAAVKGNSPPFAMPIKGEKYEIFQPLQSSLAPPLFAPAKEFISYFEDRVKWVNTLVQRKDVQTSVQEYATNMYLETIKSYVTAVVFNDAEKTVQPGKQISLGPLNKEYRKNGNDWTYLGDTMTGWARIDNVRDLLHDVFKNNVIGDYIETGVWRGGSSIFARAVITSAGETDRVSYVCDSFAGLPPGDRALDKADADWDNWPYLEIPVEVVVDNFQKYGLLDSNVVFAKGFFNETMLPLSKEIKHLSVMRLDVSGTEECNVMTFNSCIAALRS
jgi:hypothetical protein